MFWPMHQTRVGHVGHGLVSSPAAVVKLYVTSTYNGCLGQTLWYRYDCALDHHP